MSHRELVEAVRARADLPIVTQRQPYTVVSLYVEWEGLPYYGWGFSKQNRYGPTADAWNPQIGIEIARGRALSDLVDQIWHAEQARMLASVANLASVGRLVGAYVPTEKGDAWPTEA